jgi:hypothetical protein
MAYGREPLDVALSRGHIGPAVGRALNPKKLKREGAPGGAPLDGGESALTHLSQRMLQLPSVVCRLNPRDLAPLHLPRKQRQRDAKPSRPWPRATGSDMSNRNRPAWREAWALTRQQLFAPDFVVPFLASMLSVAVLTGAMVLPGLAAAVTQRGERIQPNA